MRDVSEETYRPGQRVALEAYCGPIVRVVVEDLGDVITVTTKEEADEAAKTFREPRRVGFKKRDVIRTIGEP
jgi:hypothetical protein